MDERAWCPACNGTGQTPTSVSQVSPAFMVQGINTSPCTFCSRTGRVWKQDADAWLRRKVEQESKQLLKPPRTENEQIAPRSVETDHPFTH
jgi:DnaJ-class molecular chaperone